MKTPSNGKNAQPGTVASKKTDTRKTHRAKGDGIADDTRAIQHGLPAGYLATKLPNGSIVDAPTGAKHNVDVDFTRAGDPKCRCDICLAELGSKMVSKRADVGVVIFWEAALVTALLESIGDGVSTAEAVTLAERHLKRIRALADGLLRG